MKFKAKQSMQFLCVVMMAALISACSSFKLPEIKPWVAPYEREYLADPIMSFNKDPLTNKYRQHVYSTREAARGATNTQGGGCGCN